MPSLSDLSPIIYTLHEFCVDVDRFMHSGVLQGESRIASVWSQFYILSGARVILRGVDLGDGYAMSMFGRSIPVESYLPHALQTDISFSRVSKVRNYFNTAFVPNADSLGSDRNRLGYILLLFMLYILLLHFIFRALAKSYVSMTLEEVSLSPDVCRSVVHFFSLFGEAGRNAVSGVTDSEVAYLESVYQQLVRLWAKAGAL